MLQNFLKVSYTWIKYSLKFWWWLSLFSVELSSNEREWIEEFEKELDRQLNSQEIEFVRWLTQKAKNT
jgi:hypothetical protein